MTVLAPDALSDAEPAANRTFDRGRAFAIVVLYACATLQFIRFYVVSATFYLNLPAYLAGTERLPFQYRILPAWIIRGFYAAHILHATGMHTKGAFTAERAPLYLISIVAFPLAALFTQGLYNAFSRTRALRYLIFPAFLFTMAWTYTIHVEANFSYPYDMLSVAFFAAGLYCIAKRRYLGLLAVLALGTLNRETTLLLIPVFLLDTASVEAPVNPRTWADRFNVRQIPWLKTVLLAAVWLAIKVALGHRYGHNDRSEDYLRIHDNLHSLSPRLWPALLNICGYMMPIVLLFHRDIRPWRFRNYLWIFPIWFAVMFCAGVIAETRIYGELCPYVAVALALIIEHRLQPAPGDLSLAPQA